MEIHAFNCRRHLARCVLMAAGTALLAAGCAAPQAKKRPTAQIEVQQDVGFTITEAGAVGTELRAEYEAALSLLRQERYAEGIQVLERVVEQAPDVSAPRIDLGVAYHRAGDLEAAERHLKAALELNPDHPIVHNELGIIYRKTGRFAESRASYERALSVYPGFHYARRNLGVVCDLYLNDLECARDSYEAYLKTVPADDEAAMWLADIRSRLGQEGV